MSNHTTIPELWEAFLQAEDTLKLKVLSLKSANKIKAALSTYKNRILKTDPDLANALGKFTLAFTITPASKNKYILEVGMQRSKAKPRLDVEIIEDEEEDNH